MSRFIGMAVQFRVKFLGAVGTDAVSELCFGMVSYVCFYLLPVALIVPNFLARRANRKQSAQLLHVSQRFLKLRDQPLLLFFKLLALCNVPEGYTPSQWGTVILRKQLGIRG